MKLMLDFDAKLTAIQFDALIEHINDGNAEKAILIVNHLKENVMDTALPWLQKLVIEGFTVKRRKERLKQKK
jgi:hypothetical protein